MFSAPLLSNAPLFSGLAFEAVGVAPFASGFLCNTRTYCNGLQS